MLSPTVRYAAAALPIGLATVFVPDHSPRALVVFLVAHSALGLTLFVLSRGLKIPALRVFGFMAGLLVGLAALVAVIIDSTAANLASLAALLWGSIWISHWYLNGRSSATPFLSRPDLLIQVVAAASLTVALALSFGDPIASTGFVGVYLVVSGLHLGIVAASPRVG